MKVDIYYLKICFATALCALAQTVPAVAQDFANEMQQENGASYVCGGIGDGEADKMRKSAGKYDLMLTFAQRDGSFLAGADVDIFDVGGRHVVDARCDGPIMLINLPKRGKYSVRAEVAGKAESAVVNVETGEKGRLLALTWPAAAGAG